MNADFEYPVGFYEGEALGEEAEVLGVVVVVADIEDDVDALVGEGVGGRIEGKVEGGDEGFEVGAFTSGAEADGGTMVFAEGLVDEIDAEVDPGVGRGLLEGAGDGSLSGAGRAVEDDDGGFFHALGFERRV